MKIKSVYLILLSAALIMFGCANETLVNEPSSGITELSVSLPITRGTTEEDRENTINTLRMIVFKTNSTGYEEGQLLVNKLVHTATDVTSVGINEIVPVGYLHIYFIANEDNTWDLGRNTITIKELKATVATYSAANPPKSPFVMFGEYKRIAIDAAGVTRKDGSVFSIDKVERIAAKMTLKFKCERPVITGIDWVQVMSMPKSSTLSPSDYTSNEDGDYFDAPQVSVNKTFTEIGNAGIVLYVPEYLNVNRARYTWIKIKATGKTEPFVLPIGNGYKEDGSVSPKYMETSGTKEELTITRNTHYTFTANIKPSTIDISSNIEDWKPSPLDTPISGESITASNVVLGDTDPAIIDFVVNPVPVSRTVAVDWSGMPATTIIKPLATTATVDANGKGTIKVEWTIPADDHTPFNGKIKITSGNISKIVNVQYGIYIPDPSFRAFLKSQNHIEYINNDYGLCSITTTGKDYVGTFDLKNYKDVTDLTGIEHFPKLTGLLISGTSVAFMDISKNPDLITLDCSKTKIKSLDVTNNILLQTLACTHNNLTVLDVTKNTLLKDLRFNTNSVSTIDLSQNSLLSYLSCTGNSLTSLDLSKNTVLSTLWCNLNNMEGVLDVTPCQSTLTYLYCDANSGKTSGKGLTGINIGNAPNLKHIDCSSNNIGTLDISTCKDLATLDIASNPISNLEGHNVTANPILNNLDISSTPYLDKATIISNLPTTKTITLNISDNSNFSDINLDALIAKVGANLFTSLTMTGCVNIGVGEPNRDFLDDKSPTNILADGTAIKALSVGARTTKITIGGSMIEQLTVNGANFIAGTTLTIPSTSGIKEFSLNSPVEDRNLKFSEFICNNPSITNITLTNVTKITTVGISNNSALKGLKFSNCGGTITGSIKNNSVLDTTDLSKIFVGTNKPTYTGIVWE